MAGHAVRLTSHLHCHTHTHTHTHRTPDHKAHNDAADVTFGFGMEMMPAQCIDACERNVLDRAKSDNNFLINFQCNCYYIEADSARQTFDIRSPVRCPAPDAVIMCALRAISRCAAVLLSIGTLLPHFCRFEPSRPEDFQ